MLQRNHTSIPSRNQRGCQMTMPFLVKNSWGSPNLSWGWNKVQGGDKILDDNRSTWVIVC